MRALAATLTDLGMAVPTQEAHSRPPFSAVSEGIAALDAEDLSGLSSQRLGDDLRWLSAQERAIQALQARRLAELDRRQDDSEGSAVWLQDNLGLTPSAAHAHIRTARLLQQLPATAGSLRRGEISAQHVSVICRAMDQVPKTRLDPASTEHSLLEVARRQDPHRLHDHWLELRYQSDQEAAERAEAEQHERRWLNLSRTRWGTYRIAGELDPVNGGLLRTALEAVAGKRRKDDRRTPTQRRTDSIGDLARRLLDAGTLPKLAGERPHLMLVADLATLRLEPGSRLAQLDWGPRVTGRTARRIAEDCDITPVLVDEQGEILHVGRRTRAVPTRVRKAVNLRDRHCQEPGCDATPDQCQCHHIEHWADGGSNKPPNLSLRCRAHHPKVHPENARFRKREPTARGGSP